MKNLLLTIIVLFFWQPIIQAQFENEPFIALKYEKALEYYEAKNYQEALKYLLLAKDWNRGTNGYIANLEMKICYALGQYVDARNALDHFANFEADTKDAVKQETHSYATKVRAAAAKQLKDAVKNLEQEMVLVNGGTYMMGCTDTDEGCKDDAKPAHQVKVRSFYMHQYEVTQLLWEAVMATKPSNRTDCATCPVEQVSFDDIQLFIDKLNRRTGKRYRLPKETEWEFAARGGNKSKGYIYAGGNQLAAVAWYEGERPKIRESTCPVGSKTPNELGIYDMSGSVRELCQEFYDPTYYKTKQIKAYKIAGEINRVCRGGSWYSEAKDCLITTRGYTSARAGFTLGFRLVRSQ